MGFEFTWGRDADHTMICLRGRDADCMMICLSHPRDKVSVMQIMQVALTEVERLILNEGNVVLWAGVLC